MPKDRHNFPSRVRESKLYRKWTQHFGDSGKHGGSSRQNKQRETQKPKNFATKWTPIRTRRSCGAISCSNSRRLRVQGSSMDKAYLRFGEREPISNAHWVRSSPMKLAASASRRCRISKLAGLCALLAAMTGWHRDKEIPPKFPTPVRLAEV